MKDNFDFTKTIYILIGILLAMVIAVTAFVAISNRSTVEDTASDEAEETVVYNENTEAAKSQIEEGDLPTNDELKSVGLEAVKQTSKINEQFNLYTYEIADEGIKYSYLANAVTNGERLSLTAKAMSEDEFKSMLPKAKFQNGKVKDMDVVFNDRSLYSTTSEADGLPEFVKKAEEEGNVVVRYGDSLSELLPMQQMMWYSDGIGYTLESIARDYTYEDMAALTEDYLNNAK